MCVRACVCVCVCACVCSVSIKNKHIILYILTCNLLKCVHVPCLPVCSGVMFSSSISTGVSDGEKKSAFQGTYL